MKKLVIIMVIGLTTLTIQAQENKTELMGKVKIEIDGLSCPFCAYGLEKNLRDVENINDIKIDVENAFVLLSISEGKGIDEDLIRKTIKDAGFTARRITQVSNE
jgi:mercuric ion binding protein